MRYRRCLQKIKDNAHKFELKAEFVSCYTLKIYSEKYMFDSWIVDLTEEGLVLKHLNKYIYSNKTNYHTQRIIARHRWWWILETVSSHNDYVINRKKRYKYDHIDSVLKKYNESRSNKNGSK